MTKNKEFKIYQKWWFWVLVTLFVLIVFFTIVGMMVPNEIRCDECERRLSLCQQDIININVAWNNYLDALEDYCKIDYTNLLCSAIPER